jgi:cytochrome o ubiquinol oxidase subunit 2
VIARGSAGVVAVLAPMSLAGCGGVLDPQGPVGAAERTILVNSLAIMLAIVIPTIIATLGFAWWFRAGNKKARYLPDWAYSGRIELVVWSIPILVILFLSGMIWIGSHQLDPYRPLRSPNKPVEVQVVSLDWKWLFIYPAQGVASVNELVVPAGRPVHFSLTSASVMNAFFVPQLGSMIYTMNGMVSQLHLQADRPGNYYGISAQYSGDGFSDMHFVTRALPADQFAGWIARTRSSGPVLDPRSYAALARHSVERRPFTYRAVAPGLFDAIATQKIPPSPGPRTGRPERSQHVSPEDVG